ncbi:MAG: DUF5132 domain-containing protein [Actinobacteria bacterium]|nr:DUF5132 domain-containing protein [Actinomycetota bacterium]
MSILENALKGNTATGIAIGLGAAILVSAAAPIVAGVVKPVAKAAIKSGIILYGRSKEAYAEAREVTEDLVAEARSELEAVAEGPAEQAEIKEEKPAAKRKGRGNTGE